MLPARRLSALLITSLVALAAHADDPVKRILLERAELAGANLVAITARVEAAPGALLPRHTHPGVEITTSVSGQMELSIDGRPVSHIGAGGDFQVPAGAAHSIKFDNAPRVLLATFVVEKDKPMATPAP
jgi:quercetin dioxygenase-like cupin family protein